MNPSVVIILLMTAICVVSFGCGYALCLIGKEIAWEARFHKTANKLRILFDEDETKSLDWIHGAQWALSELIKKGD